LHYVLPLPQSTHIDEMPGDRSRGRHHGAHEMRAPARALPSFEVAVRRRRAPLARPELVVVHAEAHRAAGLAPLEARVAEDTVESLALGLRLHEPGPRYDEGELHVARDATTAGNRRGGAEILDSRIGARPDEHLVDRDVGNGRPGLESHVR